MYFPLKHGNIPLIVRSKTNPIAWWIFVSSQEQSSGIRPITGGQSHNKRTSFGRKTMMANLWIWGCNNEKSTPQNKQLVMAGTAINNQQFFSFGIFLRLKSALENFPPKKHLEKNRFRADPVHPEPSGVFEKDWSKEKQTIRIMMSLGGNMVPGKRKLCIEKPIRCVCCCFKEQKS